MTRQFLPYTPDVEFPEPGFEVKLQTVLQRTERFITESVTASGTGRAVRDAHAKGYGPVRGRSRSCADSLPSMRRAFTPRPEGMTRSSASPMVLPSPEPTRGLAAGWDWR
jgi:hypothetical protein